MEPFGTFAIYEAAKTPTRKYRNAEDSSKKDELYESPVKIVY